MTIAKGSSRRIVVMPDEMWGRINRTAGLLTVRFGRRVTASEVMRIGSASLCARTENRQAKKEGLPPA
jgi:hypothetical protein